MAFFIFVYLNICILIVALFFISMFAKYGCRFERDLMNIPEDN